MKKEFTPIAMKCNKEQFEAIKPKLEKEGIEVIEGCSFYDSDGWLVNNYGGGKGLNVGSNFRNNAETHNRGLFETWNEKVFLQACGIETEQEYTITKSQLLELKNGYKTEKLREWFPEAFEMGLEVGKWIFVDRGDQSEQKALVFYQGGETPTYGFTHDGYWSNRYGNGYDTFSNPKYKYSYPTESEVFEALKNEAVKRGFAKDVWFKVPNSETISKCCAEPVLNPWNNQILYYGDYCIFKDGVWAEIIPTLTRKEAEKKLGVKIVD